VFGAGYAWSVGRRSSANVAYQYRANEVRDVADPLRSLEHSVDFSFDHRPHITSSRQARLNFKVGLSASDVPVRVSELPPGSVPDAEGPIIQTRQYTMHASAGINYPIGRDWTGYANYERGLAYVGLVEPLNSNTVNAGIEGLLTRRLRFLTSAAYSQGSSLRRTVVYNTYTGTGGLNFAITRGLALYADYQYYFYDFGSSVIEEIDETRPPDLERHSVRVGVAVWVPMLER
jgi:opacity protein-like surface antigen